MVLPVRFHNMHDARYFADGSRYLDRAAQKYNNLSMSRLSFKTFCIELYADYKSIPGNEAYALFEKNGILKMLDEDYDVLHGHGFGYVLHDIDEIPENGGL